MAVGGAVQDQLDARLPQATRPQPTTVLLEAVPTPPLPGVTDSAVPTRSTLAGDARTGLVWAEPGLTRGTAVDPDRSHSTVTAHEGAIAALGTLIVGWTLTAAGGTVGRRRLEEQEHDRWAAGWAGIEPEWSGRVP